MKRILAVVSLCILAVISVTICVLYSVAEEQSTQINYWTQSKENIYVAAHRGWSSKYPENTMAAYKGALEIGVDQIEVDVRVTKDNELVLIHDETVDRTTDGKGKVCEMTLSQLKKLDAGDGEKIPTLRELMELVKDHPTITLDIELKEYPNGDWEEMAYSVCDQTLNIIDKYNFTERCVINSSNGKLNDYIHDKYKDKYKQHLYYPQKYMEIDSTSYEPYYYGYCVCVMGYNKGKVTKEELIKLQQETGIRLWVGTAYKNEKTIDMAIDIGVELITCNNPDKVLAILREKGLHK